MRQGWGIRPDDNLEHLQRNRLAGGRLDDLGREVWRGNRRLLATEPDSMQVGDIVVLPLRSPPELRIAARQPILVRQIDPAAWQEDPLIVDLLQANDEHRPV